MNETTRETGHGKREACVSLGVWFLFSLVAHRTPHWKDPATAAALKLRVKDLLDLE
jgi:hypothetical protein